MALYFQLYTTPGGRKVAFDLEKAVRVIGAIADKYNINSDAELTARLAALTSTQLATLTKELFDGLIAINPPE